MKRINKAFFDNFSCPIGWFFCLFKYFLNVFYRSCFCSVFIFQYMNVLLQQISHFYSNTQKNVFETLLNWLKRKKMIRIIWNITKKWFLHTKHNLNQSYNLLCSYILFIFKLFFHFIQLWSIHPPTWRCILKVSELTFFFKKRGEKRQGGYLLYSLAKEVSDCKQEW